MSNMKKYGFNSQNIKSLNNELIGRVIAKSNNIYNIITNSGEVNAEISDNLTDYPVIGDFVTIETQNGNNYIYSIINRKNKLIRKGEWDANSDSVIAANIDIVFIMISLANDFHIEKLKAYISIANKLNTETIIVLSKYKSDIPNNIINEINDLIKDMKVIKTPNISNEKAKIRSLIHEGQTVIFIGPEHDKINMINEIYGNINLINQLSLLPGGGIIIDTPEMRELGIENINILSKFADIL